MALGLDSLTGPSSAMRMYGALYGKDRSRASSQRDPALAYATEEQKASALQQLAEGTLNTVETIGRVLDYPGAIARGVLAGDPLSGFSWDADRRVTGRELLESYGLLNKDSNPYLATAAGLAAEIATDPLGILTTAPLSVAGKAARAAGILDKASDAATLAMGAGSFARGAETARDTLRTGRAAYKWLGNLLPAGKAINRENAAFRPLVGPRVARSMTTLEEVVKLAPNPTKAVDDISAFLQKRGIDYDAVKGDKLGGALGLGYFGLVDDAVFNPQAARPFLDALDYAGQATRWSAPVRYGSSLFDKKVSGEFTALDQLGAMRGNALVDEEIRASRALAGEQARLVNSIQLSPEAQRLLGADTIQSPQGRDFLTRLYEGTQRQSDLKIMSAIGKPIEDVVKNWDNLRTLTANSAKGLGMYSAKMQDAFGALWSPRIAREATFGDYGSGLSRATNTARMLENESRERYLMLPGGTVDLREISQLPKVQEFIRAGRGDDALAVDEVGAAIKKYIDDKWKQGAPDPRVRPFQSRVKVLGPDGKPVYEQVTDAAGNPLFRANGTPRMKPKRSADEVITLDQGKQIARFMMRRDPKTPLDVPMFSEFPTVTQARALTSQGTARAHTRHIYESMTEAAIPVGQEANAYPGTGYTPLGRALDEVSKRVGLTMDGRNASKVVRANLQQAIAKANGVADWTTVNLNDYALPEEVFNRLIRINDFYSSPRAQENMIWLFDSVGTLFKGFALAFPATKVRDMYSNAFLLALEAGNVKDVNYGLRVAKAIVGGQMDEATALLKELPAYRNIVDPTAIQKQLTQDVSRTGILETLASSDLVSSNQTGILKNLVPGSQVMSKMDALREFIPDGSRSLKQMVSDQFQIGGIQLPFQKQAAYETRNAVLNASQKFSDYTDTVARLGGMLSLMRQGITADVAAKRITAALVDYGSLTSFERQTLRRIFPWWAYTSRIGKYVVGQLANNPGGGYAQTLRALNTLQASDEDTYIPEALRQQFAFRIPDAVKPYLGIDPNDPNQTFLTDIDVPGVDTLSLLGTGPTVFSRVQNTARNLAQQANPFIKSALELASGMDTFSRRPLQQSTTPADRVYKALYKGITGEPSPTGLNPLIRQAINVTPGPWQRLISVAGGIADERLPMAQKLVKQGFNSLAGVKLRTIDPAWQISDARRLYGERLGDFMEDYTESYVPKDRLPYLPADKILDYQIFRTLGRDLREARKK